MAFLYERDRDTLVAVIMQKDSFLEDAGPILLRGGFRRKGSRWLREDDRGLAIIDLQSSRFNPGAFYLNVGIYIGDLREPTVDQCSARVRVEHLGRDVDAIIAEALSWCDRSLALRAEAADRASSSFGAVPRHRVRHVKFGSGEVLGTMGEAVRVRFDDGTERMLASSYLEVLDESLP